MAVVTLKRRADFLATQAGRKWNSKHFALFLRDRKDETCGSLPRVGYTVTKKLGNAVVRNRIKRRLRAVVRQESALFKPLGDYVLLARGSALDAGFVSLAQDLAFALSRLHKA
jgi:ribonuclease P protein component